MLRSGMTGGHGIPLGRAPPGANRRDTLLLAPPLDLLKNLEPQPGDITVRLNAGYAPDRSGPRPATAARVPREALISATTRVTVTARAI
ncbi:hypothetical protein JOF35_006267 [Streptomyces demainii]|uniref:Uncharacterized protein n=1 Tax=Streptomyces demainii TaxID=588122 RepID=A0ABT9KZR4_9ACTN|nr:hypothetical protein [Streptomyces demainii]